MFWVWIGSDRRFVISQTSRFPFSPENIVKFIYSEKATKFWEISTVDLFYIVPVKSSLKILPNFVASSEYTNFNTNYDQNSKVEDSKSFPLFSLGLEPRTFRVWGERDNHYTTKTALWMNEKIELVIQ